MVGSEEGKTLMERFKLKDKPKPVVFVSGAVGPPKQVPSKFLKTGAMLTKALKNLLEPKAEKIETTQDLRSKCLEKDTCALLLKGGKTSPRYVKDAIQKLVVEHPKVTFAAIDSSVLYVKGLEAEFLPELATGIPRFVVFKKISGTTDKSKTSAGRLKTSAVALDVDVAYGPMSNLVASVVSGSATMEKVSTTPTVKTRTKKLEKEENAKRQRRIDREKGGSSSTGGAGGAFQHSGENDGTPEGRRAERERRRAEHRAKNPNYREKTPEELKEMERQRRIRMEEEAAKWNIAPEDADGEGDGDSGSGSTDYMDEDWDEESSEEEESDEEDDEDVMDLD